MQEEIAGASYSRNNWNTFRNTGILETKVYIQSRTIRQKYKRQFIRAERNEFGEEQCGLEFMAEKELTQKERQQGQGHECIHKLRERLEFLTVFFTDVLIEDTRV